MSAGVSIALVVLKLDVSERRHSPHDRLKSSNLILSIPASCCRLCLQMEDLSSLLPPSRSTHVASLMSLPPVQRTCKCKQAPALQG